MDKVSGYNAYQSSYYESRVRDKKEQETLRTAKAGETKKGKEVQLSRKAQDLLKDLKKKYRNMDFIVADYESEEEASAYLSRGTKEYSVLIDPELLEEMAADGKTKEKQLNLLEDAASKLSGMKQQLGARKDEVSRVGVAIDKDGSMSFFAELEKVSEKQRERIENARETKREEAAMQEKRSKRTRVEADSVEELIEKIRNVDWSKIKEEGIFTSGSKFDFSI
ncbi:MAG: DUF6033 family protein [Lachnospiraceae bacterium]|jgi:hypothetical protein|nr:hypothetical protein C819_00283 [Lachnospiraceae bacterium 10-1]MCX4352831.1 DUF6033 family protein [Lachnospiraceae bacterium]